MFFADRSMKFHEAQIDDCRRSWPFFGQSLLDLLKPLASDVAAVGRGYEARWPWPFQRTYSPRESKNNKRSGKTSLADCETTLRGYRRQGSLSAALEDRSPLR